MSAGFAEFVSRWNSVQRFNVASFLIMLIGTVVVGRWLGGQIKTSIINQSASTTALYLDSLVTPNIQELAHSESLTAEHAANLDNLLKNTDLGHQVVAIKVWSREGKILYSNSPSLIGRVFLPEAKELAPAWEGSVLAEISDLQADENVEERLLYDRLLEIHIPVRLIGSHQIIAIAEFYQKPGTLEAEIADAQWRSWLVVGTGMGAVYFLLTLFFRWIRNRIARQEIALKNQVEQLTEVISQNDELDRRVRRATANAAVLNERVLRRISAELDSRAMQVINQALTQLDEVTGEPPSCPLATLNSPCNENFRIIQSSLQTSLKEIRAITSGLGLPQLEGLSLPEVFTDAVRAHEQRTGTRVTLRMSGLPERASSPVLMTAYRLVQEALNNAYRHAGGVGQEVNVRFESNQLQIEISDRGPGFGNAHPGEGQERLGLAGMRERVESLGGSFSVVSRIDEGTKVVARLSLDEAGELRVA
jgi:signal transduction histidine kinase